MSEIKIDQFDGWLQDNGPAALVFHRLLLPVEGKQAWIFPPTFAQRGGVPSYQELRGNFVIIRLKPMLSSGLSLRQLAQITVEHLAPQPA
jgi:hypothetical protein